MIVIFGGSYNGKISYCREKYKCNSNDFFYCNDENLIFDKKVICGLHIFIKKCVEKDISAVNYLKDNMNKLKDKIIISDEINSGVVPVEKENRIYREECGQSIQLLCNWADEVYRIFFGLEEKLK